ncbi:single-stranded-DNA-specific exonuclease RecJ [Lacticaseibacillus pabuli]|uniref:Single-stranded-DNA-specific exonuclease RecJ n=1 Tax=Lacticaseibacillus pabuli TaxID=3025672 RepID=A0ABY7WUG1_9LACO|nr:single-stranded-DNA-specific exonuclease RecJ [Lacticaseibacillus sp. KACC 23028]WDF83761.1 single-stranded-DNA-specific exonuclease RecJ [Lacticaseibacillus sp. KACC 23028]
MNSRFDWQLGKQAEAGATAEVGRELGVSPLLAQLLVQRGITDKATWEKYTHPSLENLHDPFALHDMDLAVARITKAVENGEQITIYGDYDVDGITSTTIMKEALESIGADPAIYIPNRFEDGYGPNLTAYKRLAETGTQLLITVDNGVSGAEPIAWAMANGMDVIVTDHHELPDKLPDAVAVVHPRYPGTDYPFGDLSGAGVAFKVATALLGEVPMESCDLAALGAIADVVSLTDENRTFVQIGLQMMRENPRTGLQALFEVAGIDQATLDETTVGFAIAPRLNAIGRLGDATPGVKLLSTFDPTEASRIAAEIDEENKKRQKLVSDIADEAEAMAISPDNQERAGLVLAGEGWHQGVVGIVASRIVELTGKPTIILSVDSEKDEAKGSGRSVPSFHLFKGLQTCSELLDHFGGHAMAAGMSLKASNIDAFREAFAKAAADFVNPNDRLPLAVDERVDASAITMANYEELQQLAPYGPDNPQPVFTMAPNVIDGVKQIGQNGKHLRFRVDGGFGAIAFGMGNMAADLASAQKVKIAFTLGLNTFRGNSSLQLEIKDIGLQQDQVLDWRGPSLETQQLMQTHNYAFFNARTMHAMQTRYTFGGPVSLVSDLPAGAEDVVLVDMPANEAQLSAAMRSVALPVTVLFYASPAATVAVPSRAEFGSVLHFIQKHPNFDKHKLGQLARETHMNLNQVILAVQVFLELNFVTIKSALISAVDSPARKQLSSAPAYQARQEELRLIKNLQTASRGDLRSTLLNYRR